MAKNISISIPKPCSEDWEGMTPADRGRFCASCQKTVVDFRGMSDAALARFFRKQKGPVCGRLYESQLDRSIACTEEGRRGRQWTALKVAASAVGLQLLSGSADAQQPDRKLAEAIYSRISFHPRTFTGLALRDGKPVPSFTLIVQPLGLQLCTDELGLFQVLLPDSVSPYKVHFEAPEHPDIYEKVTIIDANLYPYLTGKNEEEQESEDDFGQETPRQRPFDMTVTVSNRMERHYGGETHVVLAPESKQGRWQRFRARFKSKNK